MSDQRIPIARDVFVYQAPAKNDGKKPDPIEVTILTVRPPALRFRVGPDDHRGQSMPIDLFLSRARLAFPSPLDEEALTAPPPDREVPR